MSRDKLPIPDIETDPLESSILERYADENPEFRRPFSPRARIEMARLFYTPDGQKLPDRQIQNNIRYFAERVSHVLAQLQGNESWQSRKSPEATADGKKYPGLTDDEFRALRRDLIKTLQEIFTSPAERMELADVPQMVIDPSRISLRMLENMGLEEYLPPKRVTRDVRLAYVAEAIPELKRTLASLEPFPSTGDGKPGFNHENARLMRIGRGNDRQNKHYGKVFGTQEIHGEDSAYVSTLHGARRRIDRIRETYNRELSILMEIQQTIRDVDAIVAMDWEGAKKNLPELRKKMLTCVDRLKYVSDPDKQRMRERIEKSMSFSTQRRPRHAPVSTAKGDLSGPEKQGKTVLNPGASRARWNMVPRDISRRVARMRRIRGYLEPDQMLISRCIELQQQPFKRLYDMVLYHHTDSKILDYARELSPKDLQSVRCGLQRIVAMFNPEHAETLGTPFFTPYLQFAERINVHALRTQKLLDSDHQTPKERQEAAAEFMKIFVMAKAEQWFSRLEKLYDDHLSPDKVPYFVEILRELKEMRKMLLEGRILPELKTEEYNQLFGRMHQLRVRLRQLAAEGKDAMSEQQTADARKCQALMKKEIQALRIEDLIPNLA